MRLVVFRGKLSVSQREPAVSQTISGNLCMDFHCAWRKDAHDGGDVPTEWKIKSQTSPLYKNTQRKLLFRSLRKTGPGLRASKNIWQVFLLGLEYVHKCKRSSCMMGMKWPLMTRERPGLHSRWVGSGIFGRERTLAAGTTVTQSLGTVIRRCHGCDPCP